MSKIKCLSEYDPLDNCIDGWGHLYHKIGINKMVNGHLKEVGGDGQYARHNDKCSVCGQAAWRHKIVFHRQFHNPSYYISKSGAY